MTKNKFLMLVILLAVGLSAAAQQSYQWKTASSGGYTYRYVTNDPSKSRFYTLKNSLTVVLSQNAKVPDIDFRLVVRAGSNTDPKDATGLAHYLEHLLFKGTDKFGTLDFTKEKPLLDEMEALYEKNRKTTDPAERRKNFEAIDQLSVKASRYSIAGEYDKIVKSLGSTKTNATTRFEETVYKENFPPNATDQFLALQAERFRNPIFRTFHTELEAVYEEKNGTLDNESWQSRELTYARLFPTHNYGQQTTIGTIEHLRNPSLLSMRNYYGKYYVPNNMMLAFAGDFNPDELIKKIDLSFAYMQPKPLTPYSPVAEKPLTSIQRLQVYGPGSETLKIFYRGHAGGTRQSILLSLISSILFNNNTGLLDINLNKQQIVQYADAFYQQMKDYSVLTFYIVPKSGQSLQQAEKLLMDQIDLLKKGQFDEEMLKAIVNNKKLFQTEAFGSNPFRLQAIIDEFSLNGGKNWDKRLGSPDAMGKVTKKEIVEFANHFFKDNYVVAYKNKGESKNTVKVERPAVTPITTNASATSDFAKQLLAKPIEPVSPEFLDYKRDLHLGKAGIADVITVRNTSDKVFRLSYKFDFGSHSSQLLPFAARYLAALGTGKYSAEEISKRFYNIACEYNFTVNAETATINISGLQENFDTAVSLVEHLFADCRPNANALSELKSEVMKTREDGKTAKETLMEGLTAYARYGSDNPFNYKLSNDAVNRINAEELLGILHHIFDNKHAVTYYGPKTLEEFAAGIVKIHGLPATFKPAMPAKKFIPLSTNASQVFFADYDMLQSELCWVRNDGPYQPAMAAEMDLFNSYFGEDFGSIVVGTIRESEALAYSTSAKYAAPDQKENVVTAYVGTQAEKMSQAITAMNGLLNKMPKVDETFNIVKANALNKMGISRITNQEIISAYLADQKLGFDHDSRIDAYEALKKLTLEDMADFHEQHIAGKAYNYCIVASEKKIDMNDLKKLGTLKKLSPKEIFGY